MVQFPCVLLCFATHESQGFFCFRGFKGNLI
nr:MAG TPA: hypothetical protein [Caudoviricetes sp.]